LELNLIVDKMENLISITEHSDYLHSLTICMSERWSLHRKRINFGKQLTELWMFVPCKLVDGVWVVLKKPINYEAWLGLHQSEGGTIGFTEHVEYWKAKDLCLFEGFSICDRMEQGEEIDCIMYNDEHFLLKSIIGKTIEEIVKHQFELTTTALKQIVILPYNKQ